MLVYSSTSQAVLCIVDPWPVYFCTCIKSRLKVAALSCGDRRPDWRAGGDGADPTAALICGGACPDCVGLARTGRMDAVKEVEGVD